MRRPHVQDILPHRFPATEPIIDDNNACIYGFGGYEQDIIKVEVIFDAGRWSEDKQSVAAACAQLIKSGTATMSAFELSEKIESYGADIKASAGYNTFTFSGHCMLKYLESVLSLFKICMEEIVFPETELELYKKNAISRLKVSKEKTDYHADKEFRAALFGADHPYGYSSSEHTISNLTRQDILAYYHSLRTIRPTIILAGNYESSHITLVAKYLAANDSYEKISNPKNHLIHSATETRIHIPVPKSVQATITIGKRIFGRMDAQFPALVLLNTILGGYFGSRLMTNIREDKGYTYGIYSAWQSFKYDHLLYINTDTDKKYVDDCIKEIFWEMQRLQEEEISEEEMQLAKNYLMGRLLQRIDGPFNLASTFKDYYVESTPMDKFFTISRGIKETDAVTLKVLAQQLLQKDSFNTIIAG
jgi:predicted Zn-dependent peptidase